MLSLAISLALAAPTRPARADWPQFRGPTGQGQSSAEHLPLKWSATQNIRWKQPIPGEGWSSPVIVGGRIYLTTAAPTEGKDSRARSLRTLCLDAATGAVRWNTE
ncbi:MAG: PQQ-binding-like beta-propeller repeat protein, partial [Phycisphaerae bacterium]|nr:PQQ-binding-like beta-propeller repeat protein [Phycisphaerae bacterium]